MPAWLAAAITLAATLGPPLISALGPEGDSSLVPFTSPGIFARPLGAFGGPKKRRRRRRALTASDRADIAFITGLLGPTAGKNFALTIATRTG